MTLDLTTLLAVLVLGGALAAGLEALRRYQTRTRAAGAEETARRIVEEARKEADAVRKEAQLQAKDVVLQARGEFEREVRDERRELQAIDKRLLAREEGRIGNGALRIAEKLDQTRGRRSGAGNQGDRLIGLESGLKLRRAEGARLRNDARGTLIRIASRERVLGVECSLEGARVHGTENPLGPELRHAEHAESRFEASAPRLGHEHHHGLPDPRLAIARDVEPVAVELRLAVVPPALEGGVVRVRRAGRQSQPKRRRG